MQAFLIHRVPRTPPGLLNKAYGSTAFVKTSVSVRSPTSDGKIEYLLRDPSYDKGGAITYVQLGEEVSRSR